MIITVGRRCQKTVFELHIIAVIHSQAAWNIFFKQGGIVELCLNSNFQMVYWTFRGAEASNSVAGYLDFTEAGTIE